MTDPRIDPSAADCRAADHEVNKLPGGQALCPGPHIDNAELRRTFDICKIRPL